MANAFTFYAECYGIAIWRIIDVSLCIYIDKVHLHETSVLFYTLWKWYCWANSSNEKKRGKKKKKRRKDKNGWDKN